MGMTRELVIVRGLQAYDRTMADCRRKFITDLITSGFSDDEISDLEQVALDRAPQARAAYVEWLDRTADEVVAFFEEHRRTEN